MDAKTIHHLLGRLNNLALNATQENFDTIFGPLGAHVWKKFRDGNGDWVALFGNLDGHNAYILADGLVSMVGPVTEIDFPKATDFIPPVGVTWDVPKAAQIPPSGKTMILPDGPPTQYEMKTPPSEVRLEEWALWQGWNRSESDKSREEIREAYDEATFIVQRKHTYGKNSETVGLDWFFDLFTEEEREGVMALQAQDSCETEAWVIKRLA
jgi:hypothetical protein